VFPKTLRTSVGQGVVDSGSFGVTLQAAIEARRDPDTVIIARTDARAPNSGSTRRSRRANLYAAAERT